MRLKQHLFIITICWNYDLLAVESVSEMTCHCVAGSCTTSWCSRRRNTCVKWQRSTRSGSSSLRRSSSSLLTRRASLEPRNNRRLSRCTTSTRNRTHGGSQGHSRRSTLRSHSRSGQGRQVTIEVAAARPSLSTLCINMYWKSPTYCLQQKWLRCHHWICWYCIDVIYTCW